MNVFNLISAGGGGGSGLYIWKKYAYTPKQAVVNPQFTTYTYSSSSIWFKNANFDLTAFDNFTQSPYVKYTEHPDFIDFFDGWTVSGATNSFIKKITDSDGYVVLQIYDKGNVSLVTGYTGTSTYCYFNLYTTGSLTGTGETYSYDGTKYLPAKIGDLIGYVVSDKSDAYPDGGEQGGFYYEKYTIAKVDEFGFTNCLSGAYTPTSDTRTATITVSEYKTPFLALIYGGELDGSYVNLEAIIMNADSNMPVMSYTSKFASITTSVYSGSYGTLTKFILYTYSSYYKAGTTYQYRIFY